MQCSKCGKQFVKEYTLRRHEREFCQRPNICEKCGRQFSERCNFLRHQRNHCVDQCPVPRKRLRPIGRDVISGKVTKLHHAFKNRIASYRIFSDNKLNYIEFLNDVKPEVINLLNTYLQHHTSLKINFEVFGLYVLPEKEMSDIKSMNTKNKIITASTNLDEVYDEIKEEIMTQASEFQEKDSGWSLQELMFIDVNINKNNSISASSYIKLPKNISQKNAVLNIVNEDNACFAWSVNAAIFPADGDPKNPSSYPHYDTGLDFTGIDFPMRLKDIVKFERLNNISVNVFGLDISFKDKKMCTEVVGPLHFTKNRMPTHVNLLLLSADSGKSHYCLIQNLSCLVRSQKTKHRQGVHICDGCLQFFPTLESLNKHQKFDCNHICTELPTTELKINKYGEKIAQNILKFENIQNQLTAPFVIYADFESLLKPFHHNEPNNDKSFTVKVCEHQAYSFALYMKCNFDDRYSKFVTYRGLDAEKVFVEKLEQIVHDVYNNHLKHIKPMTPLTYRENQFVKNVTCCHICEKPFKSDDIRVLDHCHLTGKFRGVAHQNCNLNYKLPNSIPVFFHNLTNYDSHLFIKNLALNGEDVSVIAQNKEKYISFSKSILVEKSQDPKTRSKFIRLKFVDSFRFLPKSIDKLSETLESEQCVEVRKFFPEDHSFNLIRQKGVFPYSYVDSFEKLEEGQLPSKEHFFNTLTSDPISDKDHERAKTVWSTFNCKSLGEYSDVYLKSDVLLLADIFENFRKVCLEKYKLDPAQYITAPSLSWDAMLRMTEVELELLTDIDMHSFFKKGIRGGVCQCSKRKAVANNKFIQNHDPSKPSSFILYLDATSMYGASMSQYLPTGGFRWLTDEEIQNLELDTISDEYDRGYVFEVDLEYPTNLHDAHNDLPFCPQSLKPPKGKIPKLILSLYNKEKYIIHYRNLKQCLKYGLKLAKVHRILEFSQSPWLKKYIDFNTQLRNASRNDFEKDLFKFLINSIFGKTMENLDKRQQIYLCSRWENKHKSKGAGALIAQPNFKTCSIFDKNLVAVHMQTLKVTYDKPIYVGFSILDISKTIIYDFFYGYIKQKYGDLATLLYTDTDSLILEISTDNVYNDIKQNINYFDTSNYTPDNIHNIPKMPSVIGRMKDEFGGTPISSFYGTGAKAYAVKLSKPYKKIDLMKKAKGVARSTIKHALSLSDYVNIVENGGTIFRKMYIFRSHLHTIYTELKNKIALNAKDDKRYVLPHDGINTLAWGHLLINRKQHDGNIDALLSAAEEINFDYSNDLDNFDINQLMCDVDLDNLDISQLVNDVDLDHLDISQLLNVPDIDFNV